MRDLNTFVLIARREFLTRARSRFFRIGTVVLMVLLAGYIVLQALVFSRAVTTIKVGFAGDAQALAAPLKAAVGGSALKVETHLLTDMKSGQGQVLAGTLDAFVSGDPGGPDVAVKDSLNPTVAATLDALAKAVALNRALASSGVDATPVEGKVASANIHLVQLDPNATLRLQRQVVGVFVAALLYVALVLYGQLVAAGVVEEKSNRIVEILLSTVRARQLLLGKVVGIGLVGFVQLLLLGVVALITVQRTHVLALPSVTFLVVAGGLLWFVLGFLLYALVFAAAGSLVSRQEEIGAVTAPVSLLIVFTYLVFFWVEANPDNPIGVGLSMLPPFAPVLMPARIATGDAQVWQVVVAVVLIIAAIAGMNALAARIYTNSVLRIGTRVKLSQAWRGTD